MELFTPAWNSKNPEKRMNAVKEISGIEKLQKIAVKADYDDVRQEAWKFIAIRYRNEGIAAVEKLTDQTLLKEVVVKASYRDVKKTAVEKLTDQASLKEIALKDSNSELREAAVKKLTDQNVLIEIAKTDKDKWVRKSAIEMITDQNVLIEFAKTDKHNWMCWGAIQKLSNPSQELFAEFAKNGIDNYYECQLSIDMLTNKSLLKDVAKRAKDIQVQKKASERLSQICEKTKTGYHIFEVVKENECYKHCLGCGVKIPNYKEKAHQWQTIIDCKKRCTKCGILAYAHNYERVGYTGGSDDYKCSSCGHDAYQLKRYDGSNGWEYGRDTFQTGFI